MNSRLFASSAWFPFAAVATVLLLAMTPALVAAGPSVEAIPAATGHPTLRQAVDLFFIGSLLMIGCYHLVFYCFRRTNIAILHFSVYCLLWAINFLVTYGTNSALSLFLPGIPEEALLRFEQSTFLLTVPSGYLFFAARFPDEFPRRLAKPIGLLYGAFILWMLSVPIEHLTDVNPVTYSVSFLLIVMTLVLLVRALRAHREGAGLFLAGFAILGTIASNDMLYDLHLIQTLYLMPLGMSLFVFAQSSALSLSHSRAFAAVERLSADLEARNAGLREQMQERQRLEAEIVNLSENERRHLSHALHDGLCQQLTAARLYCDVLETDLKQNPEGERIAHLSSLLAESVDHAYDLSRGLWPVDLDPSGLSAFLDSFGKRIAQSKGISVDIHQHRGCAQCTNESVAQVYRIAQEAMTNAAKHANATRIEVALSCTPPGEVCLRVRDNGIGRHAETALPGGLGTRIMAHRAQIVGAELVIADAEGGGTEVRCRMPCRQPTPL